MGAKTQPDQEEDEGGREARHMISLIHTQKYVGKIMNLEWE